LCHHPITRGARRIPTTGVVREGRKGKVRPTQEAPSVHEGTALKKKSQHSLGNNDARFYGVCRENKEMEGGLL